MSLVHRERSWLRIIMILSLEVSVALACIIAAIRANPVATASQLLSINSFTGTAVALQGLKSANHSLDLSLRSDKWCYLKTYPIRTWITLSNVSTKPLTVLKTINLRRGGVYYDVFPIVNGHRDRLIGAIGEGEFPPQPYEYVTLLPDESITTYIQDFREVTQTFGSAGAVSSGRYTLEIEYRNGIWGIVNKIMQNGTRLDVVITDTDTWTGILHSNSITIRIVDTLTECSPSSGNDPDRQDLPPPDRLPR